MTAYRSGPDPARVAAAIVIAAFVGFTIRENSFTPWGTDAAAYIRSAHQWARHEIFAPATLLFWAPWGLDGELESPLGQRPGPERGTLVNQYPLGFPVLLAAAIRLGGLPSLADPPPGVGTAGDLAPYLVTPIFAGLLAWCGYLLASQLAGRWAGLLAAIQIVSSPVVLLQALAPMSDVPAAALWALSWVMGLRPSIGGAAAAGMAGAAAIMVRPNLTPLAFVIGLAIALGPAASWRERAERLVTFVAGIAGGMALVLWSQAVQYGDPLTPGYAAFRGFFLFTGERLLHNARSYPTRLVATHSIAVFIGLAGVLLFVLRPSALRREPQGRPERSRGTTHSGRPEPGEGRRGNSPEGWRARITALSAVGMIAGNYAIYLPYVPFEDIPSLRFILPAMTALFVLNAGVAETLRRLLASRSRLLAPLALVPILAVVFHARELTRTFLAWIPPQQRIVLMGHYLREALPPNAVVINYLQNAAIAYYTGRTIVRLDPIADPAGLDTVIDDLRRHGYHPVFVVDKADEAPYFQERFNSSRYHRLDWPPRAEFTRGPTIWYLDAADRARYFEGARWPIDVVQ